MSMKISRVPLGAQVKIQADNGKYIYTIVQDLSELGILVPFTIELLAKNVLVMYIDDGCIRVWRCSRGKRVRSGSFIMEELMTDSESYDINRRQAYRVKLFEKIDLLQGNQKIRAMMSDISYIGIGLKSANAVNLGDNLELTAKIGKNIIEIKSIVTRIEENSSRLYPVTLGAAIVAGDRAAINKFVLDRQREMLKQRALMRS